MNYLDLLNPQQRAAVECTEGPVIIIAGAGSGKTRVLTYRIAHLMQKGVDPFHILALTFTNKAAREMRERIERVIGAEARNLWMGTFHSVFAKLLRVEAERLGYPKNFTIYDTDDSKSLIKAILKEMGLDDKVYKPGIVLNRISSAKNSLISADEYSRQDESMEYDKASGRPKMAEIYRQYTMRCFKAGAMDFDDLLFQTNRLLRDHPDILLKYQHKFRYILVDEYQDTNFSQYVIIRKLAAMNENVCVVGDDAQSIYAFRGATIQNILNFQKDYPDARVFKLEQNYRSTKTIVQAAESIIGKNKDQLDKKIWTQNDDGEKIRLVRTFSDNDEGRLVAESIFAEKMQSHSRNQDFAILYRTNAQSRAMEEALRKHNIPYRIYGGMSFYQRKEIKDFLAYLRVTVNPNDEEALKRIINYPARGIGDTTLNKLIAATGEMEGGLWNALLQVEFIPSLKSATKALTDFRTLIESFQRINATQTAYDTAMHIAMHSGLYKVLHEDKTVEGSARFENLEELLNAIKEFVENDEETRPDQEPLPKNLQGFIQDIALLTDADQDDGDPDKVSLMTIHASKGLEFNHLFIVGMEENLFPSQMALASRTDLEEERRLFYVAVTRAMKKLTLSFATTRFKYGNIQACEPSRFLEEIDPGLLEMDVPPAKAFFQEPTFDQWSSQRYRPETKRPTPQKPSKYIPTVKTPPPREGFVADSPDKVQEGTQVEHQRFGFGQVMQIEGRGDDRKALIAFDEYGEKKLVLKFAKIRVVE